MMQAKVKIGSGRPGRPEKYTADGVLKTALGLYWKEGVSALSVNDLARRMGMPKPSIYRHFSCEDSLLASVLFAYEATVLASLNEIMCRPVSFSRQLTEITEALITGVKTHSRGCLLFQMREAGDSLGPVTRVACEQVFARYSNRVKDWLDTAVQKGDVSLHTNSVTATHLFLGMITLIRNGLRDGLDVAGVRKLAEVHLAGIFQLNNPEAARTFVR